MTNDLFAAENAPRVRPLTYPGARLPYSALIESERARRLLRPDGRTPSWDDANPTSWAECVVESERAGEHPRLAEILDAFGDGTTADRIPVLAIGSNSSPAQLRHKFAAGGEHLLVPSFRARVTGVRAGFAPFFAPYGAVPATVVADARATTELAVQFLSPREVWLLDGTELPHYQRIQLGESHGVSAVLETGERLSTVHAYVAVGGALGEADAPWIMGFPGDERPDDVAESHWMPTQRALLSTLAQLPGLDPDFALPPAQFAEHARTVTWQRASEVLTAAGVVLDRGFDPPGTPAAG